MDPSGRENEPPEIDPRAEDKELKYQLLKKYSGYLSSLRQEFSKKKKKGPTATDLFVRLRPHLQSPVPTSLVAAPSLHGRSRAGERDHGGEREGGVRGRHRPGHHKHPVHRLRPPRQTRRIAPARVQATLPGGRVG